MARVPLPVRLVVFLLLMHVPVTSATASEIALVNCSHADIRVSLNDSSTGGSIGGTEFTADIAAQGIQRLDPPSGRYLIKVYRVYAGVERFAYVRPNIDTAIGNYIVRATGAFIFVQPGSDCASPGPAAELEYDHDHQDSPDTPVATHMVHTGIWVSGAETSFQVREFDGRTFKLLLNASTRQKLGLPAGSGPGAWMTYRLVGRNTYGDALGNTLTVDREFQAKWNGVAHRYSWLE